MEDWGMVNSIKRYYFVLETNKMLLKSSPVLKGKYINSINGWRK